MMSNSSHIPKIKICGYIYESLPHQCEPWPWPTWPCRVASIQLPGMRMLTTSLKIEFQLELPKIFCRLWQTRYPGFYLGCNGQADMIVASTTLTSRMHDSWHDASRHMRMRMPPPKILCCGSCRKNARCISAWEPMTDWTRNSVNIAHEHHFKSKALHVTMWQSHPYQGAAQRLQCKQQHENMLRLLPTLLFIVLPGTDGEMP